MMPMPLALAAANGDSQVRPHYTRGDVSQPFMIRSRLRVLPRISVPGVATYEISGRGNSPPTGSPAKRVLQDANASFSGPPYSRVSASSGRPLLPARHLALSSHEPPQPTPAVSPAPAGLLGFSELYAADRRGQRAWRRISRVVSVLLAPALQRFRAVLLDGGTQ